MKKIMIILGAYYPNASANGICVGRVIDELLNRGHEVFCLSNSQINAPEKEDINNLHIQRITVDNQRKFKELEKNCISIIKKKIYLSLCKITDIIRLIKMTKSFPIASVGHAKRFCRAANDILEKNKIDVIIGVNMPTHTLYAAYLLKKEHPDIKFIPYCLDPIYGGMDNRFLTKKTVDKRNVGFESDMLKACEMFIVQHEHRKHYNEYHKQYIDKMQFVGVPLLVEHNVENKQTSKKILLYAGALSKETRNPGYIFEVFKFIKDVQLVMYISNGEEWVQDAAAGIDNIEVHGRITHEEVLKKMEEADAFLNIGNIQTMFCPSKIVEYIGYGKPIVSTYRTDTDTCGEYMKKYPLSVYIDERKEKAYDAAYRIENMLSSGVKSLEYEEIKELFKDNTPEYIADLICSVSIKKKEN